MKNLVGLVSGKLTVIGFDRVTGNNSYWVCQCECGNIVSVRAYNLVSKIKSTKSCRCTQHGHKGDLTGTIIGRLTVLGWSITNKNKYSCKCECGNIVEVFASNLIRNHTISCGCFRSEVLKAASTTHGMSYTEEFDIWCGMRQRCYDVNCDAYKDYGGRGIMVCDRWLGEHGFENFHADMGNRPSKLHSIDRYPNTNGNYEPTNCRWGTKRQQAQNRRYNVRVNYLGEEMVLAEFARRFNIDGTKAYHHIKTKTPKEILEYYNIKND